MKKISSTFWDKIENNNKNSFYKICFYDYEGEKLQEVARWRNSYNSNSGANYGLLQIWSCTFNCSFGESQGGWNTCGNYDKPIANLEGCLYQLGQAIKNKEIITDCPVFTYSSCGSITSLLEELKEYLQKQYKTKLFLVDCNG